MANTLLIKRSSTPGSAPSAANLELGEIALNYADGNLFYKNASNVVTVIASNQFVSVSGNIVGNNIVANASVSAVGNIVGGNLTTGGLVSATGNVSAGNINTSGQLSVTGNITGGNVVSLGQISTTGNITAGFYFGDGSQLSNIAATGNAIINGNSNVAIAVASGNVDVAVNGFAESAQFSQGSFYVAGPIATPRVVNHLSLVHADVNAVMISPVTISASGNIVVPSSSSLTIFTPS